MSLVNISKLFVRPMDPLLTSPLHLSLVKRQRGPLTQKGDGSRGGEMKQKRKCISSLFTNCVYADIESRFFFCFGPPPQGSKIVLVTWSKRFFSLLSDAALHTHDSVWRRYNLHILTTDCKIVDVNLGTSRRVHMLRTPFHTSCTAFTTRLQTTRIASVRPM
jgi:hypothetical protein